MGATSFIGVEMIVAAQPCLDASDISPSLLNLAEAIFGAQRRQIFVPLLQGQPVDSSKLATLLASLSTKGEGPRWHNLSGDEVQQFVERFDGDLSNCLNRATEQLMPAIHGVFAKALAEPLASERERIALQRCQLIEGGDAAGAAEAVMLSMPTNAKHQRLIGGRSYGENIRWNKRLLLMMARAGLIDLFDLQYEEDNTEPDGRIERVRLSCNFVPNDPRIAELLKRPRENDLREARHGITALDDYLKGTAKICRLLRREYASIRTRCFRRSIQSIFQLPSQSNKRPSSCACLR